MNKPYFNEKHLLFILPVFVILTISIPSFAYEYGSVVPQVNETPFAKTTATPHRIPGNMRFRHDMADLLGEKVGPDDSGDVYNAGGLAGYYTGPKELFPGKGKLGELYRFLPVIRWYDPAYYFNPA